MTSSAKDFSIPDFGSAEQNEDMSEDCRLATVKSLVPLNQSSIIYDEETLMKMTDEELKYFETYKRDNHAQMPSWKCTTCPCKLSLVDQDNIRIHPVLGVLVCKNCEELYSNCPFSKDEYGNDEYCRWCAKDGRILCCDTCTNVFCVDCLRRTFLRRMSPDEIPREYSCLVCYNLPLWSRRALCRMVMSVMPSTPGRKSLSRRSLQDTNVSSDLSILCLAITSEAEKLATYCKALASEVFKEGKEADGSSCHQQKDKVVHYCRKLRNAVDTFRHNMEELAANFEGKCGNTEEVDQQESSILKHDSTPRAGKQLIVKKPSGANSKQDNYAGFQESPPPHSAHSNSTKDSFRKSIYSLSSQATIPYCPSPLPTEEQSGHNSSSNEAEAQPNKTTENVTEISKFLSTIPVDEVFFQVICSDSDSEIPMETDESREESVIGLSTDEEGAVNSSGSNSPRKSICSQSSRATIPHCPSPLPTEEQSGHNSSSNEAEAQPNATEKIQLPTTSSIPDRNECVLQLLPSDSDLDSEETENIPDEAPESAEEKIIIECDSKKSQKGKEGKEEKKKVKKRRRIQSDSDFQSSESKEEKKKPKTEQVVAGRSVAGISVDQLQNFSVQQAASFFRCGLS